MGYQHIDIESATLSAFQIVKWIDRGDLDVEWFIGQVTQWDVYKNSKLIESILLDLPIPALYISEERIGSYIVLDGQKRLLALAGFVSNSYKLKGLTLLKEYEGDSFERLPIHIQRKLMDYEFSFYVLRMHCEPIIKFELLERLTDDYVDLKMQALRNRMYPTSPNITLCKQLAENSDLHKLMSQISESDEIKRLLMQELASKFIAFYQYEYQMFNRDLKLVLNEVQVGGIIIRGVNTKLPLTGELREYFDYVLKNIRVQFGDSFFRDLDYQSLEIKLLDVLLYSFLILSYGYDYNLEVFNLNIRLAWRKFLQEITQQPDLKDQNTHIILVAWLNYVELILSKRRF